MGKREKLRFGKSLPHFLVLNPKATLNDVKKFLGYESISILKIGLNLNNPQKKISYNLHASLLQAIKNYDGNLSILNFLLSSGDLGSAQEKVDLLFEAARRLLPDVIKRLLDYGIDVNIRNGSGDTALLCVINANHWVEGLQQIESVKILLDAGASLSIDPSQREMPLHFACRRRNKEIVRMLLEAGAPVNQHNHGYTPLLHVCSCFLGNDWEIFQLLVAAGANIYQIDRFGMTALMNASHADHSKIVEYLLTNGAIADIELLDNRGMTAMDHATYGRQTLALLIAAKATIREKSTARHITRIYHTLARLLPICQTREELMQRAIEETKNMDNGRDYNYILLDEIEKAEKEIKDAKNRLYIHFRKNLTEICIGLQELRLPTLVLLAIVDQACALAVLPSMYTKWELIKTIRHYKDH